MLIAGGGDSAVDWALMLEPIAESVTLIHRAGPFRADEHSVEQMMKSSIRVITPREIQSIHGEEKIEKVVIVNKQSGETEELKADAVIVSFGFVSSLGPIQNWGLTSKKAPSWSIRKMETNIPGIYAAGDIAHYPGKVKLIAAGFGEAPPRSTTPSSTSIPKHGFSPATVPA